VLENQPQSGSVGFARQWELKWKYYYSFKPSSMMIGAGALIAIAVKIKRR